MKLKLSIMLFLLCHLSGCSKNIEGIEENNASNRKGAELAIYEVNPKLFTKGESFKAITGRLNSIKDMGINVLWIMPIYVEGSKNSVGSPYCIRDYKAVNPDYGTLDDLKNLVKQAHSINLKVLFDWVPNHTSWDNNWINNKGWYTQDENGDIISPAGMGWKDVADLNYDNAEMRSAMIDAMKYWANEVKIDGYRCDYAEGVPNDFWKQAIKELKGALGNEFIMLAEGSKPELLADGFDILYGWNFNTLLQEVFQGKKTIAQLHAVHKTEYAKANGKQHIMRYSNNHDLASEKSPITTFGGERGSMAAFVIASMFDGIPLIYSSQEIGYDKALSFFNFNVLDWNSNTQITQEYKNIISAFWATAEARSGALKVYETGKVASFYKKHGQKSLFVMVNTTKDEITIKTPIERAGETFTNLITNQPVTLSKSHTLSPYEYLILGR